MKLDLKMLALGLFAITTLGKRKAPPGQLRVPKAGARLTLEELRELARQAGFVDANLAAAVAMAESGGFADAVGDSGTSFGLWQIHKPSHPTYDAQRLLEPAYNADAAFAISKHGADWSPWTTYKTGAYQRYMPPAISGEPEQLGPAKTEPAPSSEAVAELVLDDDDEGEASSSRATD